MKTLKRLVQRPQKKRHIGGRTPDWKKVWKEFERFTYVSVGVEEHRFYNRQKVREEIQKLVEESLHT